MSNIKQSKKQPDEKTMEKLNWYTTCGNDIHYVGFIDIAKKYNLG